MTTNKNAVGAVTVLFNEQDWKMFCRLKAQTNYWKGTELIRFAIHQLDRQLTARKGKSRE